MNTVLDIVAVEVPQRFDYEHLQDQRLQDWAMAAAGTIRSNIAGAVQNVLEAGRLLRRAKERLPHGFYLPWVQEACGLKPQYAQKLIKAAEFVNAAHERHLTEVTDANTLFLLSADATPEDVREWFMERCASGDVPSRAEVKEKKRAATSPRSPQPAEVIALSILRKGELERFREALALAERATITPPQEVMKEQRLRDLGKLRFIAGAEADFHKTKSGDWIRLPHAGRVEDCPPVGERRQGLLFDTRPLTDTTVKVMTIEKAADLLGFKPRSLTQMLTPGSIGRYGPPVRGGYRVERSSPGMVSLTPCLAES